MAINYDIKQDRPELYRGKRDFEVVDVPAMQFLMADGRGNPNESTDYAKVVEALYTTSYAVRAVAKETLGRVHTVGPLEGLWTADDLEVFKTRKADEWEWTMMIVQPDWITADLVEAAKGRVKARKQEVGAASRVRFETFAEGKCVQILYIGPYDQEAPTIARMHQEFLPSAGLKPRGDHHEIYLSDPRRTDPGRLRTILRQSVS